MASIHDLIKSLAGTRGDDKLMLLQGEVKSVDLNNQICEVETLSGTATLLFECMLNSGVSDGVIYEPVVGSDVYFLASKSSQPFIVQYSDIKSISLLGDEFGGLIKIDELVKKINNLEDKIKDIILKFNTHSHPSNGAPSGVQIIDNVVKTKKSDLENTSVTHGS